MGIRTFGFPRLRVGISAAWLASGRLRSGFQSAFGLASGQLRFGFQSAFNLPAHPLTSLFMGLRFRAPREQSSHQVTFVQKDEFRSEAFGKNER